jgi:glycosyltransferase involved in cell wall biosynthesis
LEEPPRPVHLPADQVRQFNAEKQVKQLNRPAILAVTDRVGQHLANGSQVFADALLQNLGNHLDLKVIVEAAQGATSDRPYRVLDSSLRAVEPLTDWLRRSVRDMRVDLVYNLGATAFSCGATEILAHIYPRAKLVNHFQVNLASYAAHEGAANEQVRAFGNAQLAVARIATRNIFPSFAELARGPLGEFGHDRSCVVVNPFIDASAPPAVRPHRPFTFLAAGRFSDYVKGSDLLFRAFAALHAYHGDVRLETAGENPRFAHVLGKSAGAWTHRGWLDRRSLHEAMRDADIVLVPSRYEPFGLVAIEAMAMGTPVIAMGVGGLGEMIHHGQTGWLTKPEDGSLGLRLAMERAMEDRALTHRVGRRARLVVRREYALSRVTSLVRTLLDNAMHEGITEADLARLKPRSPAPALLSKDERGVVLRGSDRVARSEETQ